MASIVHSSGSSKSTLRSALDKKQDTVTLLIAPHGREKPFHLNLNYRLLRFIYASFAIITVSTIVAYLLQIRNKEIETSTRAADMVWQNRLYLAQTYRKRLNKVLDIYSAKGIELHEHVWGEQPVLPEFKRTDYLFSEFEHKTIPLKTSLGFLMTREAVFRAMPIGMPLDNGYVSSLYGERISPFGLIPQFHTGVDFANAIGTPIYAAADGVVFSVTTVNGPGLGIHAKILHKYGFMTVYGHMSELLVEKDQKVKRGDVLGLMGQTGTATGPHLHYEVHLRYEGGSFPYEIILNPWLFVKEEL